MNAEAKNEYPIENGIPIPEEHPRGSGRKSRYPFRQLQVGDSFFVPSRHKQFSHERQLCTAFHKAREIHGYNLQWRAVPDGFRIWREPGTADIRPKGGHHGNGART